MADDARGVQDGGGRGDPRRAPRCVYDVAELADVPPAYWDDANDRVVWVVADDAKGDPAGGG